MSKVFRETIHLVGIVTFIMSGVHVSGPSASVTRDTTSGRSWSKLRHPESSFHTSQLEPARLDASKMRLRLTVQRNGLPAANILWSVSEKNSTLAYTVTRLLEDVNHIIPLETEHWGLEHYVVEVGGFECLHFSPVMEALKEDDQVSYVASVQRQLLLRADCMPVFDRL